MTKALLIVSTGRCVWDDLEIVKPFDADGIRRAATGQAKPFDRFITMAVNCMIFHWPWHLDFAVSGHSDFLPLAVQIRLNGARNKPVTYSPKEGKGVDHHGKFKRGNRATSGMYAACVGLHLGYDKIIIVGVPFDDSGHFYDPPGNTTNFEYKNPTVKKIWMELKEMAGDKIRFVSGNFVSDFGEYSEEWLREEYEYVYD
jgi:hypothetical protein